jgi:cysteinyl-tRNA synthetase
MAYSLLDTIGNTPLVQIRRLSTNPAVTILAKLEYMNPGGSIKDRAALYMIEAGERSGELTPAKTVIEATSGNTGIGLALVCAVKGYRLMLAMAESVSMERQAILRARGAELLLTPGHLGTDGAIEEVYRLVRENPTAYFMTDQYNNPANCRAHQETTAPEIWRQTDGRVTHAVATMGTTGTLMGLAAGLKAFKPDVRMIAVEPYMGHKIQGLKNIKESYCPEIFDKTRLDEKFYVDDEEAFETTRRLAKDEGLFVGMSSGAAMAVALRRARHLKSGVMVVVLPDSGERYLSTPLFKVKETAAVHLYDTLSRSRRPLETHVPGKVTMYSCGPTAHARMGLNNARRFVFADLLRRYLEYRGYAVRHVMNITDFDDKTIRGSEEAGEPLETFTARYIDWFRQDLDHLRILPADVYPRASENVDAMVKLAGQLVQKGFAYEKLRSLYFDISRFNAYGRLSGIDLDKIRLGHTVDLDEYEKDNPRDFTLFKRARLSELKRGFFVKTEWGNVRPSWHIQCAALSLEYLGASYDIHTGGRELIFPHHENEIAIAEALTGKPLARHWVHCDRVAAADGEAPQGAFPTIADMLAEGFSGRELRYWLVSTHYHKPLRFSRERLVEARHTLRRLDGCVQALSRVSTGRPFADLDQLLYDIRSGFIGAMDEDLNISAALASIFAIVRRLNSLVQAGGIDPEGASRVLDGLRSVDRVLQIFAFEPPPEDPEVVRLVAERHAARSTGDWARADRLREALQQRGVQIQDPKL